MHVERHQTCVQIKRTVCPDRIRQRLPGLQAEVVQHSGSRSRCASERILVASRSRDRSKSLTGLQHGVSEVRSEKAVLSRASSPARPPIEVEDRSAQVAKDSPEVRAGIDEDNLSFVDDIDSLRAARACSPRR
jgi:hypothetical protein